MLPLVTWTWPETPAVIAITILVALVLRWLLLRTIKSFVDTSVKRAQDRDAGRSSRTQKLIDEVGGAAGVSMARAESRARTLGAIMRSATTVTITVIAVLQIMDTLGAPMGAVLASAGIGGAALAFGAQSLIKDFISGTFMIMEDQFGVGDVIDTGEVTGTVEDVALRITRLRDANGQIWYVRNGEIIRIGNQSQGWSMASVSVPAAVDEDAARVIEVLNEAMDAVWKDPQWDSVILERPEVAGVDKVTSTAMTFRIFAKCAPTKQFGAQRGILAQAQEALRAAGVRGPTPVATAEPM